MSLPTVSIDVMFDNTLPSGNARVNTLEGGVSGTTITTGNSGGASGNAFNNIAGSPQYSSTQAYASGLSAFNPSAGVDCHIDWTGVAQAGDVICARFYLYLVSAPAGAQRVFVLLGPGNAVVSALWMFSDRSLRLYLGFSTSVAAMLANPVPVGQWVRIEVRYTINALGNGTAELYLYTTPSSPFHTDYNSSGTLAWPGGKPQTTEFHLQRDAGGYWHMDGLAVGDSKIGPIAGTWTDVTPWAKWGIETRRGSSRVESPRIRYDAGTAKCTLDNTDRRFDSTNLAGPYVTGGRSRVTAMKPIRYRATWNGITYNLWRGFIDEWDIEHIADVSSLVTVTATDGFKVLRNRKRPPVTSVGAGENAGARVTRILDGVGWPLADRAIATGNSTLQATTLEGEALAELQAVAESEIGELYIDGSGRVVFRNRQAIILDARSSTVQATFGVAGTRTPARAKLVTDDVTFYNEIRAARVGGVEQVAGDPASQAEFLVKTFQASDLLLQSDTEVEAYAGWILYVSKEPEERFDAIEIHAHADPDTLFPHVLGREIGDRIRIIRRPSGGGAPIQRDVFIRGITHVTGPGTWITTWTLQSATKYGSFFTLDNPVLGLLDSNALGY
ncbi:hypothetical protein [Nonomuraea sp. CA-141351]|uniref:hypothetical protein n=1 Tax=Nonomuraea sp. CA-141351 TaxID=3239996 RepID=UPI003D8C8185